MRTGNTFKKILAMLLSITLIFTTVPFTAFAVDTGGCTHEHNLLCGYTETVTCLHEHDEACGGLSVIPSVPNPLVEPSETGGLNLVGGEEGCICEHLCAEDDINGECTVCAEAYTECLYIELPEAEEGMEIMPLATAPSFSGGRFFANGTPIIIKQNGSITSAYASNGTTLLSGAGNNIGGYAIYGGWESGDNTGDTSITIQSGTLNYTVFGGSADGSITGNTNITVTGGTLWYVYGGSLNGSVSGKATVTINNASLWGGAAVYGGGDSSMATTGSTNVTITNTAFLGDWSDTWNWVYGGGWAGPVTGEAKLSIDLGSAKRLNMACGGGNQPSATVGSTNVTIKSGEFNEVYGGGYGGAVNGNVTLNIDGGSFHFDSYGGGVNSAVTGNTEVNISGGTFPYAVYGGGVNGAVTGKAGVNISGGTFSSAVYGGGQSGTVGSTAVDISGGTINNSVFGGGNNTTAGVLGNTSVTVRGNASVQTVNGGGSAGSVGGTATVLIKGTASVAGSVYGGSYLGMTTATPTVGNTVVTIQESAAIGGNVHGGCYEGIVNGTTVVNFDSGSVTGRVYGGGLGGSAATPMTYGYGKVIGAATINMGGGAVFNNAYEYESNISLPGRYSSATVGAGSAIVYGSATITYMANDAVFATKTITINQALAAANLPDTIPTKAGYIFSGWNDINGIQYSNSTRPVIGNLTLYAQWMDNMVTITFMADSATHATKTIEKDTKLAAADFPANPTKAGYRFTGWIIDGGTTAFTSNTTVSSNITVTATWESHTYSFTLSKTGTQTFAAAAIGYSNQPPLSVTVTNTGTDTIGTLDITLTGANSTSFTLDRPGLNNIVPSGENYFTVVPNTGLSVGTYTATVTVTDHNNSSNTASFNISFTVNVASYGISLDPTADKTFTAATVGYAEQTAHNVTVNNTGNQTTGALTIALSGTNAASFVLSKTTIANIAVGGSDSFSVKPNTGLSAGTYTATVTVSGGSNITASLSISFTVNTNGGSGSGSGSGGGGSSATSTTPETTVPVDLNGQTVNAILGSDGTLTLTYTSNDIQKHADNTGEFTITVPNQESVALNINLTALGSDDLAIQTDFGTITISNETLQALRETYGDTLRLVIVKGSFKIALLDKNKKEVAYSDPSNPFTVTLPYTLQNGLKPGAVVAVGRNDEILPFGVYENGFVTFKITATGTYDVKYNAKTFSDIFGHWAADNIDFVAARGLFNGDNGQFMPGGSMTRAMFAQVLANLDGADLSPYKTLRFGDVAVGQWYAGAIEWAVDNGIVSGIGNGQFAPNTPITREQMAGMLYNYMKYKGYAMTSGTVSAFADESNINSWAIDAVTAVRKMGIVGGKPGNLYDPQGVATRAEVATIFTNFIKYIADENI